MHVPSTICHVCDEWGWPNVSDELARFAACCHVAVAHPADYHRTTGGDVERIVAEVASALRLTGLTPRDLHQVGRAFYVLSDNDPAGAVNELAGTTLEAKRLIAALVLSIRADEGDHAQ